MKLLSPSVVALLVASLSFFAGDLLQISRSTEMNTAEEHGIFNVKVPDADSLADYELNLKRQAVNGDAEASRDLNHFLSLSGDELTKLARFLRDEDGSYSDQIEETVDDLEEKGGGKKTFENLDVEVALEEVTNPEISNSNFTTYAASNSVLTRSVSVTTTVKFLGLTMSKTKVAGRYQAKNNRATKVLSTGCTVQANNNPLESISSKKNSAYISNGKASFECKVVVTRYALVKNKRTKLSTRSGIQYVTGSGAGKVLSKGWR